MFRRWGSIANRVTLPCLVALIVLILAIPEQGPNGFLEYPGVVATVITAVLVVGLAVADNPAGWAERWLACRPLRLASHVSYPLYLWHLPIFFASARWLAGWSWQPSHRRLAALGIIVFVTDRCIEHPVTNLLRDERRMTTVSEARKSAEERTSSTTPEQLA